MRRGTSTSGLAATGSSESMRSARSAEKGIFLQRGRVLDCLYSARRIGVEPQHLALVAAHAWDIHGAGAAGLTTAFVARGKPFPATMMPPHITAESLTKAAEEVVKLS
jgi:2-haloacid dehalogenase